jgi:iron complex transport system substrate-binding protein
MDSFIIVIQRFDRLLRLLLIGTCMFVLTVACGSPVPQAPPESLSSAQTNCHRIQHQAGTTEVCGQPQTIAALSPPLLDVMLALGVQPAAYATVDLFTRRQFDRPSEQIPYLGEQVTSQPVNLGSRDAPSQETLLRVSPDLILGEDYQATYYDRFSSIAPTLLFNTLGPDRWKQVMMPIAQVLGRETQAQQVLDAHTQLIANTKSALAPVVAQQKILVLGFDTVIANSFILERQDFICGLLQDLGFQVINFEEGNPELTFSLEVLPQLQTDMILVMPTGDNTIANAQQQWQRHPILQSIPAFKAGKVYFADYQLARIRGPIAAQLFITQMQDLILQDQQNYE